jgi:phosphoserine phosphatase RsbU/P
MPQKPARIQYLLLAVVATLALLHAYRGARFSLQILLHGDTLIRTPFYSGNPEPMITKLQPEAEAAGLARNDTVLSVNGLPYTGLTVLNDQAHQSSPGDLMKIEYRRGSSGPVQTATIHLSVVHPDRRPAWEVALQIVFTVLPIFCLLTGLWVVFARPRNPNAWLILGILGYFDPLFISSFQIGGSTLPFALFWNTIAQIAMPLCLMFLGVYFPQRSPLDLRVPWVKWLIAIPVLAFIPLDLFSEYCQAWNFTAANWIDPFLDVINAVESVLVSAAIFWFFATVGANLGKLTGDARRRLRLLTFGTGIGLTPFFILVVIALIHRTELGEDIPQWIDFSSFLILLLFPLTLAYVVVVQRAMDLQILIRQGTRYAFARQSVAITRILLAIWMAISLNDFFKHPEHQRSDVIRIFVIIGIFFAFRFLLSSRLQQKIDQRFFREAYSTEQLLSELSDEARNFTEVGPLLDTITRRLGSTLHIERIAVFLRSGETFHLQLATGIPGIPGTAQIFSLPAASTTITTLTRAKAPANVYRDDPSSWLVDATDAERTALSDLSTELLVPLPGRNRLAGVIALGPKRSEEPYTKTDRQLLQTIASQTGLALENAELLEKLTSEVSLRERISREIEIAREVQERLFPQTYPIVPGIDLAGFCRPAQVVGGDYYDFFLPSDETSQPHLAIALGDISGKGISAALLMASLRASLRSIASLQQEDLAALISHVNKLVYESSTANRYATFFYAEYNPKSCLLTYVNAGHNPPYILRGVETIPLEATGTVVGLLPDADYAQATIQLQPGDVLLAFTDGISEAMNHEEEEWGEDHMLASARKLLNQPNCTATAQQLLTCIFEAADQFTSGAPQHDDMTLLVCTIDSIAR